ncbi:TonB-dependent receptor [Acetobacteroides hydrogenigenes]|uniref:Outer membrane cobalamin receptor n=1 Tax=Acetobacteroides hydrogenigenes TaxID=979970 RepID=A0A4R2EN69_9BACT|nr:TonB-dependent receptor [Acetobacteroides hydrogenigenes]TCN70568.1 outer membrane cobalamin receptor [Acetobacteroides hydrogenigenes]
MINKLFLTASFLAFTAAALAQVTIKGRITDKSGNPLIGTSVVVKGSIDGTSADTSGSYILKTRRKGLQTIAASFIGYEPFEKTISLSTGTIELNIVLKEKATAIQDVVITAGAFEAGDKKKGVTLKPLDILTTASATGDIYGAINTLPGTATIADDGRLFVRGGDAYESLTYIDGLRVKKPYSSTTPDLPSRGRYSPQMFTGTTFSSGGYSAQYGQALSSALILQTTGIAPKSQWGLGIMSVGVNGSETFANERSSISVQVDYYNLKPYLSAVKQQHKWNKYPETFGTTVAGRQKIGNDGLLKLMATFQSSHFNLDYPDYNNQARAMAIDLKNSNLYTNLTYSDSWGKGWSIKTGVALSLDKNNVKPGMSKVDETNTYFQSKVSVKKEFSSIFNITGGAELAPNRFRQSYSVNSSTVSNTSYTDNNTAAFVEGEAMLFNKLAVRGGVRSEYSDLLGDFKLAPRASLAWLLAPCCQISVASGIFYQTPEDQLLRFTHDLKFEKATHYIANFQVTKNDRIFRTEVYYKEYDNMVRFDGVKFYDPTLYNNGGNGFAKGLEVFWRDQKTVRNLDYWVSYSYIDSKRLYRDFTEKVTPTFAPKHNVSAVGKWWISKLSTQLGATFSYATGRPYDDPSTPLFMDKLTKEYMDVSINASYIFKLFGKTSVLYTQMGNLLNRENIYGYNYYRDANGQYQAAKITASTKQSFFFGVFLNF